MTYGYLSPEEIIDADKRLLGWDSDDVAPNRERLLLLLKWYMVENNRLQSLITTLSRMGGDIARQNKQLRKMITKQRKK